MKLKGESRKSQQLKIQRFVCKSLNMISCSCSDVVAGEMSGD